MNIPCIKCKGNNPANCGRSFCPIIAKSEALFKVKSKLEKEDFFGSSPAPFVGRYGYPYVNVGILAPPEIREDAWLFDAPRYWASSDYNILQIVDFRSQLINSRFKADIKTRNKFLDVSKEVGMASKPVDLEINLKKKPNFRLKTDYYLAPQGPNAQLKKVSITSNPKINSKVEKVVSDNDLKANDALIYLYKNEFDENFLTRLFSIGNLGLKKNRKLVPTRWSITAVDDALAKSLMKKIKDYNESDYMAYFGGYLGNYYLILFFSEKWSYELFETYMPKTSWNIVNSISFSTDYESYEGRKTYASECAGGYYAARLPILEKLDEIKKQGSVLALRFITGEYAIPLGVWVCRESARKSLQQRPIVFSDKELMLEYAKKFIKKKFNYDLNNIFGHSILLKNIKYQKKIINY